MRTCGRSARTSRRPELALAGLLLVHSWASPARAQDTPSLEAPRLLTPGAIALPEGVEGPGAEVTVVLRITVGTDGLVREADVLESQGDVFDAAAVDSARRALFEPARRDGVAIPARIRFAVVIPAAVPAPPMEPVPDAPTEAPTAAPSDPDQMQRDPLPDAPETDLEPAFGIVASAESQAEMLERSAEAVNVVDLADARTSSADLGEVLARTEGVSVRRSAGLGGQMRFTLNGLGDERIRFFLDGVPLELAGFPMSFGNMPVFILDRVEIYRGVVPIRFGADALGGAVNLVSSQRLDSFGASVSYQVGSFGTHRLSGTVRTRAQESGVFTRAMGFLDSARNDYPIRVNVTDDVGRLAPATVRRFNDAYRAYGGSLEVGISEHRRIRVLSLRGYATQYEKELQHNTIMTVPYGGVHYGEDVYGFTGRANVDLTDHLLLTATAGYARRRIDFLDQSLCIYDWQGDCVRMRAQPGEIQAGGFDQTVWQDTGFARMELEGRIGSSWWLRGAIAPTYATRDGTDRTTQDGARDPLHALRRMMNLVTSAELVGSLFGDRLEAILFAKSYVSRTRSHEITAFGAERDLERDTTRFGAGASARFLLLPDTYIKASYEYATRLPTPDETFGNGVLISANLGLVPEVSHNVNLGAMLEREVSGLGAFRFECGGFGRFTDHLILLLGTTRQFAYQNVYRARSLGVEATARYGFPRDLGFLSANVTYQDFRNVSTDGPFASFDGERIPNQPAVLANFEARGTLHDLWHDDELSFGVTARYVSAYYRGWASLGSPETKQSIPSQLVLSATAGYEVRVHETRITAGLEARNLTNARVFDFFGVQRPGREFHLTMTLEL